MHVRLAKRLVKEAPAFRLTRRVKCELSLTNNAFRKFLKEPESEKRRESCVPLFRALINMYMRLIMLVLIMLPGWLCAAGVMPLKESANSLSLSACAAAALSRRDIKRDIQKKTVKIIPLRFGRFNWQS